MPSAPRIIWCCRSLFHHYNSWSRYLINLPWFQPLKNLSLSSLRQRLKSFLDTQQQAKDMWSMASWLADPFQLPSWKSSCSSSSIRLGAYLHTTHIGLGKWQVRLIKAPRNRSLWFWRSSRGLDGLSYKQCHGSSVMHSAALSCMTQHASHRCHG